MNRLVLNTSQPIEICLEQAFELDLSATDFNVLTGEENNEKYVSRAGKVCLGKELKQKLKYLTSVNVFDGQSLRSEQIPATLFTNSLHFQGFMTFEGYEVTNGVTFLNYEFIGGYENFVQCLPKFTDELDLGFHRNSAAEVQQIFQNNNAYDGTNPIWYSLKNYGEGQEIVVPFTEEVSVPVEYMRPDIHTVAIIEAIEKQSGKRIKSKFFQTEFARRLIHPNVGEGLKFVYVRSDLNTPLSDTNGDTFFEFGFPNWTNTENNYGAISGGVVGNNVLFLSPLENDFEVTVKGVVELLTPDPVQLGIVNQDIANPQFLDSKAFNLQQGLNEIEFTFNASEGEGWFGFIQGANTIGTQTYFETYVTSQNVLPGVKILNNSILKNESTEQYISALSDLFNLVWFYDEKNDCVIVEPRYNVTLPTGEKVQGFYKEFSNTDSFETDCLNETGDFSFDMNRNLYLRFKEDGNDKKTKETTHQHYELLSSKYPDTDTEQTNEVFAATLLGRFPINPDSSSVPLIPLFRHWELGDSDADRSPNHDFCNRILYKHGNVSGVWVYEGSQLPDYPFAAQVANGVNLGFGDTVDNQIKTVQGLAKTFYQKDFDIYNYSIIKSFFGCVDALKLNDRVSLFRNPQSISNPLGVSDYIVKDFNVLVTDSKEYTFRMNAISLNRK